MTEFNDGNEWHFITDPRAYEGQRLMYEYRVLSGSTGRMEADKRWIEQRGMMAPLLDGMLYYAKPDNKSSPEAQAAWFCDLLGQLAPNEMVMLDTEPSCGLGNYADFMLRWCAVVEPRMGTLAWVYVPRALKDQLHRGVTGDRIVKAPHYSAVPDWPHDVHQYTDNGYFPGGNGNGDCNRTNLTVSQMLGRCLRTPQSQAGDLNWSTLIPRIP